MVTRKGLRKPIAGKYKGELAEPIYLSRLRTLASLGKTDEQQVDELVDHFNTTRTAKFGLLFQHYRIDPASGDAWHHLATLLAFDHVPGMNYAVGEKPRAGRKRSWQSGLGFELIREVEAEQKLGANRLRSLWQSSVSRETTCKSGDATHWRTSLPGIGRPGADMNESGPLLRH
jgi:hypothetical protein